MCQENKLENCCFNCQYYFHANPDDDMCSLHNIVVYFDTTCDCHKKCEKL